MSRSAASTQIYSLTNEITNTSIVNALQMLRSIQLRSDEPRKIAALPHLIENDLGFHLHQAVQDTKATLSSDEVTQFLFEDYDVCGLNLW